MTWNGAIKTLVDLTNPDSPGAAPFVSGSFTTFVNLQGSVTPYVPITNPNGGSDVNLNYVGTTLGRTVNLPAAAGSGRNLRLITGPLTTPANAFVIQPNGTDVIGGGVAGGPVVLGGGDGYLFLEDTAAGKWTILDRSTNNVTSAKTGTAYVIAETDDYVPVNSTTTVTVTLSLTPVIGESHLVVDTVDASMNNITIARNGQLINGAAANKTIATLLGAKRFTFLGAPLGWYEQQAVP